MLYVFSGVSQLPDDFLPACSDVLPGWRMEQMMEYRFPADRQLSALAYLLLVFALKNEGLFNGLPEFGYRTSGKPFLANYRDLYFNISHCDGVAACELSGREVGIDVETVGDYDDDLARSVCNDKEYAWVTRFEDPGNRAKRFTRLWTRKESLVKWLGTGLPDNPREILGPGLSGPDRTDCRISSHYCQAENFYLSACSNTIQKKHDEFPITTRQMHTVKDISWLFRVVQKK